MGCRESCDPAGMTRFVLDGSVLRVDASGHAPGRGAWLHADPHCADTARRRGAFARSFRRKVDDAVLADWPASSSPDQACHDSDEALPD
nr:YlxR family protein [Brooklawnia sp. SH051]